MVNSILIVEDDYDISQMIKETLESHGYSVTVVFDGEEALQTFDFLVILRGALLWNYICNGRI